MYTTFNIVHSVLKYYRSVCTSWDTHHQIVQKMQNYMFLFYWGIDVISKNDNTRVE